MWPPEVDHNKVASFINWTKKEVAPYIDVLARTTFLAGCDNKKF